MDDTAKYKHVLAWLRSVMGVQDVPSFEVDHETITALYNLSLAEAERSRENRIILEDIQKRRKEYEEKGEVITSLLESIGLSKEELPPSTQKGVGVLSSLALTLGVDRIDIGTLYPALESVLEEEENVQSTLEEEKKRMEELTLSTASMVQSMNQLKKVLEDEEEERQMGRREIQRKGSEMGYMEGKAKEYRQTLLMLKEELTKTGVTPEVTHQEAVKLFERIQEIERELSPLESRLRVYHNLPPDVSLVSVEVERARKELVSLEDQLTSQIAEMGVED
eukprot:TRINITY_DN3948_c0_g1_i1.p1 TRINITY_DN3948_c0_g1~~TRINITY_DN3948_c0_g1_i1.p1  ORF type:complete len:279 (-),score=105.30 TRINITY_DN3948_c0_g1_i1:305-1141(-)